MSSRSVTDVSHAIVAVGSRDVSKARKFIQDYAPRGGSAQQDGLIDFAPEACGSYKAVVDHPVSGAVRS
jgi:dihydrodiol dehydrogenase / D-xylose 1-dehydrogenase (NADP)